MNATSYDKARSGFVWTVNSARDCLAPLANKLGSFTADWDVHPPNSSSVILPFVIGLPPYRKTFDVPVLSRTTVDSYRLCGCLSQSTIGKVLCLFYEFVCFYHLSFPFS